MEFYEKSASRVRPTVEGLLIPLLLIIAVGMFLVTLGGCGGKPAEVVTAGAEQEAYEQKITFTMPIEWTASVTQCNSKTGCKTRFYFPREAAQK